MLELIPLPGSHPTKRHGSTDGSKGSWISRLLKMETRLSRWVLGVPYTPRHWSGKRS